MQTDLNSGVTTHCHCWKLVRNDGVTLGFTDHDRDLVFESTTFEAASGFTATAVEQSLGLAVDNMDATGALVSNKLEDDDLAAGLWDNAEITVWRVDWTDVSKRVILLKGSIGEVSRGDLHFSAEVRSLAHVLNQPFGRMFMKHCDADLGDVRCGANISGMIHTGVTVAAVSDRRTFTTTNSGVVARPTSFFTRGKITWTSGLNQGFSMEIKNHVAGVSAATFILWELMPYDIQTGDAFTVQVGCDKTIETCFAKFNNVVNFRGFPRIPGNDAVQFYARKGGQNDGGSLWK